MPQDTKRTKLEIELTAALKEAVACVSYCRRKHKDIQSGDGIPVELFWKTLIAKSEAR